MGYDERIILYLQGAECIYQMIFRGKKENFSLLFGDIGENHHLCTHKSFGLMNNNFFEQIKAYLKTQPIKKMWVFGSFSRGEERPDSDIDLLVQYDRENNRIGLFTIIRIQQQLQDMLGRKIDLVEEGTLMPFAVDSANQDKILIYERGN